MKHRNSRTQILAFCIFQAFVIGATYSFVMYLNVPVAKDNKPTTCVANEWDDEHFCPDIKQYYDPKVVKAYLDERRSFYFQLTDKMNETFHKQAINIQWSPKGFFYDLLGPVVNICPWKLDEYGKDKGEQKRICGMPKDDPSCVVLSVGGNNNWAFEETVVQSTKCTVETFDCTLQLHVPEEIKSRVTGHQHCLGPKDETIENRSFLSYTSMLKLINLNGPPTILKMDIEGWEFSVLRSVISSLHHFPSQISIELHFGTLKTVEEALLFINYLYSAGYGIVARNDNEFCTSCTEVLFKRIQCFN